jgi:hypothetical protein
MQRMSTSIHDGPKAELKPAGLTAWPAAPRRTATNCGRPRNQPAIRHALFDQHHTRQEHRYRQFQRSGFSQRSSPPNSPRRHPALSCDAVLYTYMKDADALAIKAYLFSLPPVRAIVRTRWCFRSTSAGGCRFGRRCSTRIPAFRLTHRKASNGTGGAYLIEALADCGECHTPRSFALALDNRRKFAGTVTAGWRALDINSDKATGGWRVERRRSRFLLSNGSATGHGSASGPMGEAVDLSFSHV